MLRCVRLRSRSRTAFISAWRQRVAVVGQRHRHAELLADLLGLAEDDLEHGAVDGVVRAVEQRRATRTGLRLLAEAIDAPLALFVARRVPREVVVNDGVEVVLEVDALGEAVGGDQMRRSASPSSSTFSLRSSEVSSPVTTPT